MIRSTSFLEGIMTHKLKWQLTLPYWKWLKYNVACLYLIAWLGAGIIIRSSIPRNISFNSFGAEWRIYVSASYAINGSDNGLSPVQRQAFIWTNTDLLSIGCRLRNCGRFISASMWQNYNKIQSCSFSKIHFTVFGYFVQESKCKYLYERVYFYPCYQSLTWHIHWFFNQLAFERGPQW